MADNVPITAGSGTTIATDDIGAVHYQIIKNAYGALDSITLVSPANPFPMGNASSASGTLSASDAVVAAPDGLGTIVSGASTAGSVVALQLPVGVASSLFLIKGYTTGTVYTEGSSNTTNGTDGDWIDLKQRRTGTAPGVESSTYAQTANGYYRGNPSGFLWIRARLIGATGVTIKIDASTAQGAGFTNSGLVTSTSIIGKVGIDQTTPGTTNLVSIGTGGTVGLVAGAAVIGAVIQSGTWNATINTALPTGANTIGAVTLASTTITGTVTANATLSAETTKVIGTINIAAAQSVAATQSGTWNIGSITTLPALVAGAAIVGKVGIDQTTPGTTNLVSIGTNGTVAINAAIPTGANVIGALTANQSVNAAQINGVAPLMGTGISGTGALRVTLATDIALPTGANTIGAVNIAASQTLATVTTVSTVTNLSQLGGVAIAMGSGVTGTGVQRVVLATDVALPAGANTIGAVNIAASQTVAVTQATAANLNATVTPVTPTASIITSAATTNATSIKGSAGTLYSITVSNAGAAAAFVKIYNNATAPTVGTTVIALTIPIAASGVANINFGETGMRFGTGIALAITNLVAEADATAVAASQVKVLTAYI